MLESIDEDLEDLGLGGSSMGLGESTFRFMSAALSMRSALNRAASPDFMAATIYCCT
jgi:hypothetical protein